mgnify:CR=1 FL=1
MNLRMVGLSFRTTPIEIREKLAFGPEMLRLALERANGELACETVLLSTCNRVEFYLGGDETPLPGPGEIAGFLARIHGLNPADLEKHIYFHDGSDAVRHLFRVTGSLDSMVLGEGQIAAQAKQALESAREGGCVGPMLNALFQHARVVARRIRTETGISQGHVSVSSLAVDFVREVFDHFADKTVAVIGAGKMGELTLKHLAELKPKRILVTNRSPEKARAVAAGCGGQPVPFEQLDELLVRSDIVLSTTGAKEPIVDQARWQRVRSQRRKGTMVVIDIAVPRDFEPLLHDGETMCLYNIDDLQRVREARIAERRRHIGAAEALVENEVAGFEADWSRRRNGPVIARLTRDFEAKRKIVVEQLMQKIASRLGAEDRASIEGAFRLLQNQFLHGPISALAEETSRPASGQHTLLDALRKLFRIHD